MTKEPHRDRAGLDGEGLRRWLALTHTPGLGQRRFARLLSQYPDENQIVEALLAEGPVALARRAGVARPGPDLAAVDRDLRWAARSGNHLLAFVDPLYPPLLRETPDAPPLLYVRGRAGVLLQPQIALVGSRRPTANGARTATGFAGALARAGLVITSGMAAGIDAAGHRGALDAGAPTVAVLGTGPDMVYPPRHGPLAGEIAACGALVSEFPPGTPPHPGHFPRRNRLISGMSLATLVCEAALRSGSLITARLAAGQGREVFAVPGSIHHPLSRGCHALIREGATLVETTADILGQLGPLAGSLREKLEKVAPFDPLQAVPGGLDAGPRALLAAVGFEPVAVDVLVAQTGQPVARVLSMLLALELKGYVSSAPCGGYYRPAGGAE